MLKAVNIKSKSDNIIWTLIVKIQNTNLFCVLISCQIKKFYICQK